MRQKIETFPVCEAFESKGGCPFCHMQEKLEERFIANILGDAMMDPAIRMQTNEQGFCQEHYLRMLQKKNRLSLALMIESHLKHLLNKKHLPQLAMASPSSGGRFGIGRLIAKQTTENTCYICVQQRDSMAHMLDTVLREYEKDANFRALFAEQEGVCLAHFQQLMGVLRGHPTKYKKVSQAVRAESERLCRQALEQVLTDVSTFCGMFDYRNAGEDFKASRDAVARAMATLTGATPL